MRFYTGQVLIDRSPLGDQRVRFDHYADELLTLAIVYVYDLHREAQVPSERLSTEATYPWGPKTTEAVLEVCPFITSDRRQAFAVQRTDYYVSDGRTFASEVIEVHDTREAADAALGHHKVVAMREP